MLSTGTHPRVAMEVLGHSNIAVTMNLYSHVFQELKSEAAVKLDDVLAAKEVTGP
jgi:integrase